MPKVFFCVRQSGDFYLSHLALIINAVHKLLLVLMFFPPRTSQQSPTIHVHQILIKCYHNSIMKTNKSALNHYLSSSARRREMVFEQDEEIELYMMRRRARMRVIIEEEKCTSKRSKRQREQSSGFLHVINSENP